MLTSHFPASVAATLERISPDLLHLEQYMDFARNRQFRQTLLCHSTRHPTRALNPDVLHGLMMSSPAESDDASPDLTPGVPLAFTFGARRAQVTSPATKAALAMLMDRWPCAIDVEELTDMAIQQAARFPSAASLDEIRRDMMDDLFGAVMYGLIELHTQPPPCTNRPSDTPRAHPVAALQASRGHVVVNAHHAMHELDGLASEVLKLADGRRRRSEIVGVFVEWFQLGRLTLEDDGQSVMDLEAARALLSTRVDRALASLTRRGLLSE